MRGKPINSHLLLWTVREDTPSKSTILENLAVFFLNLKISFFHERPKLQNLRKVQHGFVTAAQHSQIAGAQNVAQIDGPAHTLRCAARMDGCVKSTPLAAIVADHRFLCRGIAHHQNALQHGQNGADADVLMGRRQQVTVTAQFDVVLWPWRGDRIGRGADRVHARQWSFDGFQQPQQQVAGQPDARL
jgi:hypothetical protein